MTITTRGGLTAALAAVLLGAAACSPAPAPANTDDALRRDLDAAQTQATDGTRPAARTQFVSAIELGREPERSAPVPPRPVVRRAPERTPTRSVASPVARRAAPAPRPAPAPAAPAPAVVTQADGGEVEAPAPRVEPQPAEPVVAAPSRRPAPAAEPGRRRGGWTMGDVIRNAPFPINP